MVVSSLPAPEILSALSATPKITLSAMKRKRTRDLAAACACSKIAKKSPDTDIDQCHLLRILAQYGLLISIVSNFSPEDLFSLAATSKATYKAIFSGEASRINLLGKMSCDGRGIAIRRANHKKSEYSTGPKCTEYVQCGAHDSTRVVETQPCVGCRQTTCNECRIHCVFQSVTEAPNAPGELPTYSGFALLCPSEMGILTPAHLNGPVVTINSPYHDQGFLDTPFESDNYASPESIEEILDFDLGEGSLRLSNSSDEPHPSPVIQAFWDYTETRKIKTCRPCRREERMKLDGEGASDQDCHCTLRTHLLDRWLCLKCFQTESQRNRCLHESQKDPMVRCKCNRWLKAKKTRVPTRRTCLWCWGIVREPY